MSRKFSSVSIEEHTSSTLMRRKRSMGRRKSSILSMAESDPFEPKTRYVPAPDKLDLSDEELTVVVDRIIEATNPNAPHNIVEFNFVEETFKQLPSVEQTETHYGDDGYLIRRDGEEAKTQREEHERKKLALKQAIIREMAAANFAEESLAAADSNGVVKEENKHEANLGMPDDIDETTLDADAIKNQFNYSYRETQTLQTSIDGNWFANSNHKSTETTPPPIMEFSATATQWEIYDSYLEHFENQKRLQEQQAREQNKKRKRIGQNVGRATDGSGSTSRLGAQPDSQVIEQVTNKSNTNSEVFKSVALTRASRVMERIMNQNTNEDIIYDFKYWDDEADKYRDFGSLLPLWRFDAPDVRMLNEAKTTGDNAEDNSMASVTGKKKKRRPPQVTCVTFNETYSDLIAVGYGSYDFLRQGTGIVCCYSLKNPTMYEYAFDTESGVMSLDFHPKYPSLLCIGLYDGTVMIHDVRQKNPIVSSTVKTKKHTDVVWQVSWQRDAPANQPLSFFSVSGDGRVSYWTVSKNEMQCTDIMLLQSVGVPNRGDGYQQHPEDNRPLSSLSTSSKMVEPGNGASALLTGLDSGTCFDFNKKNGHIFVVGTEEGQIHLCSKAYNSQYMHTYNGHTMPVYTVQWNHFHHNVFLSASADWTVKLWDMNYDKPLMSFDLGSSVGEVAWSPYSSTVFAAVTDKGYVHVFDLVANKHESLTHHQLIVKKAKLTHLAFNPVHYSIVIGDDRGCVQTLKLSPNLRGSASAKKDEGQKTGPSMTMGSTVGQNNLTDSTGMVATASGDRSEEEIKEKREEEVKKLQKILDVVLKNF